ncbi:hypothetical protein MHSWG343_06900 [Candidatus Mycoplasma haematohominis]|uniref:Uncharacterized protein n=2 Tax=Candidatus Mycoplasma haematohominis TaxID=1494318 RepID=A0A478FUG6_9MOLU|nr:hypothetical protein MHSWG343_06900 [Candidatus Mycoplasma haemohominis]
MVVDKLIFKSSALIRLWVILVIIQTAFFAFTAIIAAAMKPISATWLWEYLTLTKYFRNGTSDRVLSFAVVWLCVNLIITCFDFWLSYTVHGEAIRSLNRTCSFKESNILNKMRKYLTFILVGLLVALFMQILHGVLWWVTGGAVLVFKYFYFRELEHLKKLVNS